MELPSPRRNNNKTVPFRTSGEHDIGHERRTISFADEQKGSKIKPALLSADLVKNLEQTMEKRMQYTKASVRSSDPGMEKILEPKKEETKVAVAKQQTKHRRTTSLGKNI